MMQSLLIRRTLLLRASSEHHIWRSRLCLQLQRDQVLVNFGVRLRRLRQSCSCSLDDGTAATAIWRFPNDLDFLWWGNYVWSLQFNDIAFLFISRILSRVLARCGSDFLLLTVEKFIYLVLGARIWALAILPCRCHLRTWQVNEWRLFQVESCICCDSLYTIWDVTLRRTRLVCLAASLMILRPVVWSERRWYLRILCVIAVRLEHDLLYWVYSIELSRVLILQVRRFGLLVRLLFLNLDGWGPVPWLLMIRDCRRELAIHRGITHLLPACTIGVVIYAKRRLVNGALD